MHSNQKNLEMGNYVWKLDTFAIHYFFVLSFLRAVVMKTAFISVD
jgi:hypothetical protein